MDGEAQLEPVQRVADANLPLDLCVRQVGHDGTALDVGPAGGHIPCRHAYPQLDRRWGAERGKEEAHTDRHRQYPGRHRKDRREAERKGERETERWES